MKRWRSGCDGMISVNSIFASFAAGLAAAVVALTQRSIVFELCVALLMFAFILFAWAAEKITDAIEQNDVRLYQRSHQQTTRRGTCPRVSGIIAVWLELSLRGCYSGALCVVSVAARLNLVAP